MAVEEALTSAVLLDKTSQFLKIIEYYLVVVFSILYVSTVKGIQYSQLVIKVLEKNFYQDSSLNTFNCFLSLVESFFMFLERSDTSSSS